MGQLLQGETWIDLCSENGPTTPGSDQVLEAVELLRSRTKPIESSIVSRGVRWRGIGASADATCIIEIAGSFDKRILAALPNMIAGLPVRVRFDAMCPVPACGLGRFFRGNKVRPGCGISSDRGATGTLGCFLTNGREQFALTCRHVIMHPSTQADLPASCVDVAHADHHKCRIKSPPLGHIGWRGSQRLGFASRDHDAVAIPVNTAVKHSTSPHGYQFLGEQPVDATMALVMKLPVQKFGAVTGHTHGVVTDIRDFRLRSDPSKWLYGGLVIESTEKNFVFADHGDSGALVVTNNEQTDSRQTPAPVGLLCSIDYLGIRFYCVPVGGILGKFRLRVTGTT